MTQISVVFRVSRFLNDAIERPILQTPQIQNSEIVSKPSMKRKLLIWGVLLLAIGLFSIWPDNHRAMSPETQLMFAIKAIEDGNLATFDATVRDLRRSGAPSHFLVFLSGLRHLRFGEVDAALSRFASLKPENSLRYPLMRYTAEALNLSNRKLEAEQLLRTLLAEHPDDPTTHRWLAIVYFDLGAHDLAIPHLNRLAELDPLDFRPYRTLGEIYQEVKLDDQAIRALKEALNRNPPDEVRREASVRLAESLLRQNQFESALSYLPNNDQSVDALTIRGRCLLSLGKKTEARESLEKAIALDRESLPVLLLSADIHASEADAEAEIADLETASRLYPFEPAVHYQLAVAQRTAGRLEKAEQSMNEFQRLTDLTVQLSEKSKALLSDSANADLRSELADICDQLGRRELAQSWRTVADSMRWGQQAQNPTK